MPELARPSTAPAGGNARRPVHSEPGGAERIRQAATALFKLRGYHGTSMRELAQAARMEPASLYYHYPSKQLILVDLLDRTMNELIAGSAAAVAPHGGAVERLGAALRFHVGFHVVRRDEACVSHSELRALTPDNLRLIVVKRDSYEAQLCALLEAGVVASHFTIGDIRLTAKAVLMMCSGVSDWFGHGGRLGGDEIADRYVELVLQMVQARH